MAQVFKLERHVTYKSGKVHSEVQYGITSLPKRKASPERLLKIVRSEWGIENGLHYRRDVTFHEDATRMTNKNFARAMAIINNLVVSLLNHNGFHNHARARRFYSAYPDKAFAVVAGL